MKETTRTAILTRLFALMATAVLAIFLGALALPLTAQADSSPYIIDEVGALSADQKASMESQAAAMSEKSGVGVYLLYVSDIGKKNVRTYAKDYYTNHKLGVGSESSGILFLIAVNSRDYVTVTYGQGVTAFTDYRISDMESSITDYLHDNEFVKGGQEYLDKSEATLNFWLENGEAWDSDNDPESAGIRLAIAAVIALVLALVVTFIVRHILKGQLKSVKAGGSAIGYEDAGSFKLTHKDTEFLGTVVNRHAKPKEDDHGGGSSVDSGGFGGSGGGKF